LVRGFGFTGVSGSLLGDSEIVLRVCKRGSEAVDEKYPDADWASLVF
jgi:hypothetical protein